MMKFNYNLDFFNINEKELFFICGPCVIEDYEITDSIAKEIKRISDELNIKIIFKASFDKANRSSIKSYRGPGLEEGLKILKEIKEKYKIPIISDIHTPDQAEKVKEVLSIIQIPAFLCRQTDILLEAGRTGLTINVKKGQFLSPEDMKYAAEKIESTGNNKIMFTERGTFFGYRNLVVDFRNIPIMKSLGYPVIMDATHSVQRPSANNGVSGGNPEFIPIIAGSGVVSGANGIFLEVHPNPKEALSDGSNSLELKKLKGLLKYLKKLYNINL